MEALTSGRQRKWVSWGLGPICKVVPILRVSRASVCCPNIETPGFENRRAWYSEALDYFRNTVGIFQDIVRGERQARLSFVQRKAMSHCRIKALTLTRSIQQAIQENWWYIQEIWMKLSVVEYKIMHSAGSPAFTNEAGRYGFAAGN